jgi:hypothetical protein
VRIEESRKETLIDAVKVITAKTGLVLLTDDDILLLACAEIARTYTYEEKGYLRR